MAKTPEQQALPPWPLVLAILFAMLLLVMAAARCAAPAPKVNASPLPRLETAPPESVAETFMTCLQTRDLEQASRLVVAPEAGTSFDDLVRGWLGLTINRLELGRRHPRLESSSGNDAVVVFDPPPDSPDSRAWRWTMVKLEPGWRILRMQGGPLDPAEQRPKP